MTDQERKMLKSYLTECLEPRLRFAEGRMEQYRMEEVEADDAGKALDADLARKMRRFYEGQRTALVHAIDDFRELFEEDLKEGE